MEREREGVRKREGGREKEERGRVEERGRGESGRLHERLEEFLRYEMYIQVSPPYLQPTKPDHGRSSLSEAGLRAKAQPEAPFPGPSRCFSSPGGLGVGPLSPDSVFSHQDSSSPSDGEYRSTYSHTPSPDHQDECRSQNRTSRTGFPDVRILKENGVNGSDDVDLESSDEVCLLVSSDGKNGVSAVTSKGGSQEAVKINSMATHLSTILLSEDVTAVISSSQ